MKTVKKRLFRKNFGGGGVLTEYGIVRIVI
jgi:hypothetical protein